MPRSHNFLLDIHGPFMIMLSLSLLVLPLQWIGAALLAGMFHELCHAAAVLLCGGKIYSLRIGIHGAAMDVPPMPYRHELLCALAGPLGGFLLLPLAKWIPRTVLFAVFHSLYNLLPVYPMDGGRALRCFTRMLLPEDIADQICRGLKDAVCILFPLFGVYAAFVWKIGIFPILLSAATLYRIRCSGRNPSEYFPVPPKMTCKPGKQRVQ